jgi:hypothetical protein
MSATNAHGSDTATQEPFQVSSMAVRYFRHLCVRQALKPIFRRGFAAGLSACSSASAREMASSCIRVSNLSNSQILI